MPRTVITVASAKELEEEFGLSGGWDEKGPYTVRPYLCDWSDKETLIAELAGGSSYSGPFGTGIWSRTLPFQDPENATIYVNNVTWKPHGKMLLTSPISYEHAIVTATFRRPDFTAQPFDDSTSAMSIDNETYLPYCTQEIDFGAEWFDIPNSSIKFATGGLAVNVPVARRMQSADFVLTFHQLPFMPYPLLEQYADCINSVPFLGRAAETVMFLGGKSASAPLPDGSPALDITLHFKRRAISWNKFLRPDGLTWDYVVDGSGNKIFQTADLTQLLLSNPGA